MQRCTDDILVKIFKCNGLIVLLPEVPDEGSKVVLGLCRLCKYVHGYLEDHGLAWRHRLSHVRVDCVVIPEEKTVQKYRVVFLCFIVDRICFSIWLCVNLTIFQCVTAAFIPSIMSSFLYLAWGQSSSVQVCLRVLLTRNMRPLGYAWMSSGQRTSSTSPHPLESKKKKNPTEGKNSKSEGTHIVPLRGEKFKIVFLWIFLFPNVVVIIF